MRTIQHHKGLFIVVLLGVLVFWLASSSASDDVVPVRRGGVVYSVGEQKTDMARMVEAYEKLSSQYLSMVQQNLTMMSADDQQILNKLNDLEKKIDALTEKVDVIQKQTESKTDPKPIPAGTN